MAVELIKWPGFFVKGRKVTPDQAHEIILRTNGVYFGCNDHAWEDTLKRELGIPTGRDDWRAASEAEDRVCRELGMLDLEYLQNGRIASARLGGPTGWCNWDGTIFCNTFNIGKWPTVEAVEAEWRRVAKAFPYLELECQLMDQEAGGCPSDEDWSPPTPVVGFTVRDGSVTLDESPGELVAPPGTTDVVGDALSIFTNPARERGCTIEMFRRAVELARASAAE